MTEIDDELDEARAARAAAVKAVHLPGPWRERLRVVLQGVSAVVLVALLLLSVLQQTEIHSDLAAQKARGDVTQQIARQIQRQELSCPK